MSVEYLDLSDYLAIAAEVTGLDLPILIRVTRLSLADSALHAPAAGFGDTDLYPDFVDKAAVLLVRLAKNHPLPDGNKRAAWAALVLFIDLNGGVWNPDPPNVDEAEAEAVARAEGTSLNETIKEALAEAVERRRRDPAFKKRLRQIIHQDRELLERLAR